MINQKFIPPLPQRKNSRQFLQGAYHTTTNTQRSYGQQLSSSQVKDELSSYRKSSLIIQNQGNTKSNGSLNDIQSPKGIHFSQCNQTRSLKNSLQTQISTITEKLQELSLMVNSHELKINSLANNQVAGKQSEYYGKRFSENRRSLSKVLSQTQKNQRNVQNLNLQFQIQNIKKQMQGFFSKANSVKSDLMVSQIDRIVAQKLNKKQGLMSKVMASTQDCINNKIEDLKIQLADTIGKNNTILSNFIWKFEQNISNTQEQIQNIRMKYESIQKSVTKLNEKNYNLNQQYNVRASNNKFIGNATILKYIQKFQVSGRENMETHITELIYKIDSDGYLLDNEGYYLVNSVGNRIQLEQKHIEKLGILFHNNYYSR